MPAPIAAPAAVVVPSAPMATASELPPVIGASTTAPTPPAT
ncbi:hypothetical protein [Massilia sp. Se16.2.3]|nr:hypothetical protein [Massilia sp. Se16.2.3]